MTGEYTGKDGRTYGWRKDDDGDYRVELDGAVRLREAADAWIVKVEAENERLRTVISRLDELCLHCGKDGFGASCGEDCVIQSALAVISSESTSRLVDKNDSKCEPMLRTLSTNETPQVNLEE